MSELDKIGEMARKNWFLLKNDNSDRLIDPLLTVSGQANDTRELATRKRMCLETGVCCGAPGGFCT